LYTRHPHLIGIRRVERADDYFELQRIFKQAHLKVLGRVVIGEQHGAPFNVEDTVRRAA
jgi:hypothetical protein